MIEYKDAISIKEMADLVVEVPDVVFNFVGEPGIGKSSCMSSISKRLPKHHPVYLDCAGLDFGDVGMYAMNHEKQVTSFYPSELFKLTEDDKDTPCIYMYDEYLKSPPLIKNILHPTMERHNRRLGNKKLHKDTRVFTTGNETTDGVGDSMQAHTKNRLVTVRVAKPTATEWLDWAAVNNIHPVIMSFVKMNPQCMASYLDGDSQKNNPYIFNPTAQQDAFFSPRSAHAASNILWRRDKVTDDSLRLSIDGAVGRSASADIMNIHKLESELVSFDECIANPKHAKLPNQTNGAALIVLFGAIQRVDRTTLPKFMAYLSRFDEELQSLFCITLANTPKKQEVGESCKAYNEWLVKNYDLV